MEVRFLRHGQTITRDVFYREACDPARSVAVEACAGSGKTWLLVSRMLRALLAPVLDGTGPLAPHEIMAITFTRKAAGEMQQRLDTWLAAFAQEPSDDQLVRELDARGIDPDRARSRLTEVRAACAAALLAPRPVQVRTIHGWFVTLVQGAPLSVLQGLDLPLNLQLLEDATEVEAIQMLWPRLYRALDVGRAERADFMSLVAEHGRYTVQQGLEAALGKWLDFVLADQQSCVDGAVQHFAKRFPEFARHAQPLDALLGEGAIRHTLEQAIRVLGRAKGAKEQKAANALREALEGADARGVVGALMTKKAEPAKFSKNLSEPDAVWSAQELVQRALQAQGQHEAWSYHQRMARVTRVMITEFATLKRERGWVDFHDIEHAALRLLSDPVISGWIQQRLDMQVRHLLIDEFQDTSPLQWQALHAWLSAYGGAGADAPSVFIVGDPKQSIYRFRGAEPRVFEAAQAFVRDGLGGLLLACDHTWRNAQAVIRTVNLVMGSARTAGEYDGFRDHSSESGEAGQVFALPLVERPKQGIGAQADAGDADVVTEPVPLWRDSLVSPRVLPEERLRARECQQVARWVAARIAEGEQPGDIMVLARMRERLVTLEEELRQLHIPCEQPERLELIEACEVQDLLALLDVLVSPAHDLALARVLRSPLFGMDDAVLIQLALQKSRRTVKANGADSISWFDLICDPAQPVPLLSEAGRSLARWKLWTDRLPPHDALVAIFEDADVWRRFAMAAPTARQGAVLANLRAFLATSLDLDGGRYASPYALVRRLRRGGVKAAAVSAGNVVRLLTIHGAKGLEARLVIMLDCDAPASMRARAGILVERPSEHAAPSRLVFLRNERDAPACCSDLQARENTTREREELNALYVAMTRARSCLVVSGLKGIRKAGPSWWDRITAHDLLPAEVSQEQAEPGNRPSARTVEVRLLSNLPHQLGQPSSRGAVGGRQTPTPRARLGSAMHRLLQLWPMSQIDPGAMTLNRVAHEFMLSDAERTTTLGMARRIVSGHAAWAWDPAIVDQAFNEVELMAQDKLMRLDRLVRRSDTGQWWVLDYKSAGSSLDRPALVEQLNAYRAAVRQLHAPASVMAAFLAADGSVEILP